MFTADIPPTIPPKIQQNIGTNSNILILLFAKVIAENKKTHGIAELINPVKNPFSRLLLVDTKPDVMPDKNDMVNNITE